ncbi:MAG: AbrB/MazE/SpoVT family DNA-binding domain-containing protein [Chloroflexi bacterium]|nr:MAG: AbrB/MazE/SpoVT family DNA-binding domain-containing protein [Chloroflexota bacterium]TME18552.1 MAG: AbrB/MazE/SpoVT family DNA-binding domain-containing protein [Chloroflexota bacterium]TME20244.1 MAG: AbrB/MazE/SpoVT family DNA-binding domain-containing protein [Chloroflexota bacterium]
MKTTIDGAGRIVVPKALRDELGVKPGQALEVELRDGRLEIYVAPVEMHLARRRYGPVAVPKERLPSLSARLVRETLERTRR